LSRSFLLLFEININTQFIYNLSVSEVNPSLTYSERPDLLSLMFYFCTTSSILLMIIIFQLSGPFQQLWSFCVWQVLYLHWMFQLCRRCLVLLLLFISKVWRRVNP